jgi:hypothetical protein
MFEIALENRAFVYKKTQKAGISRDGLELR